MKHKAPKKKATHTMPDGKVMAGASHKAAAKKKPAKKMKSGY
jgi:hypothetical protein|tara:strand:- start:2907 stop:3032 length:126 start_codon:yes stop_codon:yes gene_type:complete